MDIFKYFLCYCCVYFFDTLIYVTYHVIFIAIDLPKGIHKLFYVIGKFHLFV